jgi:hypothetical protein
MRRLFNAHVVLTLTAVVLLILGAALVFQISQPEPSSRKSLLFAVKAITTSGVPDNVSIGVERFLIGFLPLAVCTWAAMIDALVSRRHTQP